MTRREARRKIGSRTIRRSGTKSQAILGASKPSGKGALAKYRHPRRPRRLRAKLTAILRGGPWR